MLLRNALLRMALTAEEQQHHPKKCHACSAPFKELQPPGSVLTVSGVSPLDMYRCPECKNDFCAECDLFVHEVVHVCPGCG